MSTRVQDVEKRLRKQEEAKRIQQAQIRAQGEAGMEAHTQAVKSGMVSGGGSGGKQVATSQNMGSKIQAAQQGLSMMQSQGGPTDSAGGAMSGAMQGASTGMAFGPKGAIIGGVVGAGMGIIKARQARKQKLADIEKEKQLGLARIEENKADRMNNALMSLQNAFSNTLV